MTLSRIHTAWAILMALSVLTGCDRPVDAGAPTAAVPDNPWIAPQGESDPAAEIFASCASCHMADASGRSDGTVPRLAGQRESVLVYKLQRLHAGSVTLPVMLPYARSLSADEVSAVARYVASLPVPSISASAAVGSTDYGTYCASCHGLVAEGNDALLAPRLCGQHAAYITRRMDQIAVNARGDANPAMMAIVPLLSPSQRDALAQWLAQSACVEGVEP